MQIRSLTEGAIRTVLYLAQSGQGRLVPGPEICRTQEISPQFLIKVVRCLARRKIISGARGVGGGFRLARPPEEISLLEVVESAQGPFVYNECLLGPGTCSRESRCPVHLVWRQVQESTETILSNWTVADLAWVASMRQRPDAKDS